MFFASALVGTNLYAQENCSKDVLSAIEKYLTTKKHLGVGNVVSTACKPWPHDNSTILSATAFQASPENEVLLSIAMLDRRSNSVIAENTRTVSQDAAVHFGEGSLKLDTAPYHLAKGVTAFGVRFTSDAPGPSCADGAWSEELNLYVRQGTGLRFVLQGLAMERQQALEGCFGPAASKLIFERASLSLSISKTSTNGLADLVVTAKISEDGDLIPGTSKSSVEHYTLRFDGHEYREPRPSPWWLTIFRP